MCLPSCNKEEGMLPLSMLPVKNINFKSLELPSSGISPTKLLKLTSLQLLRHYSGGTQILGSMEEQKFSNTKYKNTKQ